MPSAFPTILDKETAAPDFRLFWDNAYSAHQPAGATWPGGGDPRDRELRLAPTFPALNEVRAA
jgi:hypothetical protein